MFENLIVLLLTLKDLCLNILTLGWYGRHEGAKTVQLSSKGWLSSKDWDER